MNRFASLLFLARPLAALLALLCALAGCGPGIGGTGTGSDMEGPTGTAALTPAAVCDSELAPLLNCAAGATAAGSALRWWADGSPVRDAQLRIEGNGAEFEAACTGWRFSGSWAVQGDQPARFHGTLQRAGLAAQTGSLVVQRADAALTARLFDAEGRALTGLFLLQPVASGLPAGSCP